ncbi:winged helix-turn-helix transcriptional regulator [Ensifer adhaerens]|uniref:winged helix-turn-helix transcriptional regulator n=1 Tax=Ensifer adhaerens TaxID=106592 RepID=UPI0008074AC8|nr:response regulator transcription factor [Ensifer adhaerens]
MPTAENGPLIVVSSRDAGFSLTHRHILAAAGYSTDLSLGAEDFASITVGRSVGAVLLDVPDASAAEFCQGLKQGTSTNSAAIVALLRAKAAVALPALVRAGADEVFVCPVEPQRYLDALKHHLSASDDRRPKTGFLCAGGLAVDPQSHRASWRGEPFHLGLLEFRLLGVLIGGTDKVHTRRELIEHAWPSGIYVDPRTVNVHVARLRKALFSSTGFEWIRTVRGVGYGLAPLDPGLDHPSDYHSRSASNLEA